MLRNEKKELANALKIKFKNANTSIVLSHTNLKFTSIEAARRAADTKTTIIKIKNTLAMHATAETDHSALNSHFKNEKLFILSDNLLSACKTAKFLCDNNNKTVQIISGTSHGGYIHSPQTIIELSRISSPRDLQSRLLRAIMTTSTNILRVIKAKFEEGR
jgi:ribosomal protein L10